MADVTCEYDKFNVYSFPIISPQYNISYLLSPICTMLPAAIGRRAALCYSSTTSGTTRPLASASLMSASRIFSASLRSASRVVVYALLDEARPHRAAPSASCGCWGRLFRPSRIKWVDEFDVKSHHVMDIASNKCHPVTKGCRRNLGINDGRR